VLACRVRTGHTGWWFWTFPMGLEFDARMTNSTTYYSNNKKYIIVMTDGMSGYTCGTCGTATACSGTCTSTSGTQDCHTGHCCTGNGGLECTNNWCDYAANDAICSACSAYNNYDIKVYSIGFGPVIDCQSANTTLTGIASCGHGTYYGSKDPDKLKFIYGAIAEEILNVTNRSQTINITGGNMAPSILYPESYIEFGYTPVNNASYGEISVTDNKMLFTSPDNCTGSLPISSIVTAVSDAKVTSYSAEHWTDYLSVNGWGYTTWAFTEANTPYWETPTWCRYQALISRRARTTPYI